MIAAALRFRQFAARAANLARQDSGLAAVEFSLILPILVLLWFGGVELTQALSVDRRLNNVASAIGDLVAQYKNLTEEDVGLIFSIAPGAMFPFCGKEPDPAADCDAKGLGMRITAVDLDEDGNATIAWSLGHGVAEYEDENMNLVVPVGLRGESEDDDRQVIVSEVFYIYRPAVGYVLTDEVELEDRMFFVPRLSDKVGLCTTLDPTPTGCV